MGSSATRDGDGVPTPDCGPLRGGPVPDGRGPDGCGVDGGCPELWDAGSGAELTPVAVAAMGQLVERWRLSDEQARALFGGVPAGGGQRCGHQPPALTEDQLTRVSLVVGIFAALCELHGGELADTWVLRPNTNELFGGRAPLEVMADGGIPAMAEVRALLEGRCAGL